MFIDFIKKVVATRPEAEHVLFMDNCSIHKSKVVQKYCEKNHVYTIYNIPYRPEFSGIELVWGHMKRLVRPKITAASANGNRVDLKKLIVEASRKINE